MPGGKAYVFPGAQTVPGEVPVPGRSSDPGTVADPDRPSRSSLAHNLLRSTVLTHLFCPFILVGQIQVTSLMMACVI